MGIGYIPYATSNRCDCYCEVCIIFFAEIYTEPKLGISSDWLRGKAPI